MGNGAARSGGGSAIRRRSRLKWRSSPNVSVHICTMSNSRTDKAFGAIGPCRRFVASLGRTLRVLLIAGPSNGPHLADVDDVSRAAIESLR